MSLKKKILIVSPAKSGTHLILNILKNLNLEYKGKLEICSYEEGYYSLSNTFHTSFKKFFYTLDKETFDGGKLLPIYNYLGIVNCRHPADIFFSYLNYSFINNNTSYSNMNFKNEKDKIEFIYENGFYEDFFKSLYEYTAWSKFDNFITVSFESLRNFAFNEKVSKETKNTLTHFIPEENLLKIIKKSFQNSDTFFKGKIGEGINYLKNTYPKIFEDIYYKKYCDFYGYNYLETTEPLIPIMDNKQIKIFDNRPKDVQITIQANFHKHNIVYFNEKIYAIPFDISQNEILKNINNFLNAYDIDELKYKILNSVNKTNFWKKNFF